MSERQAITKASDSASVQHRGRAQRGTALAAAVGMVVSTLTLVLATGGVAQAARTPGEVVRYDFTEGTGSTVTDVGAGSPMNLTIANPANVTWVPDGLTVDANTKISSVGGAAKVVNAVKASGAFTLEAWVTPAAGTQSGPARIMSNSPSPFERNFLLGQGAYQNLPNNVFSLRSRTSASLGGTPELFTSTGVTSTNLTHVVATRNSSGQRTIYVNGVAVSNDTLGGNTSNWNSTYPLVLGNVATGDRPWLGTFCLVAVYDSALSLSQVTDNFDMGCGGPPNTDPVVNVVADQNNDEGDSVAITVSGSDGDGDALTFSAANLPAGLTINSTTGEISGTIGQAAANGSPYTVSVAADDGNGGSDSASFDWTVGAVNVAPVLGSVGDQTAAEGQAIALSVSASDVDGDVLTYSAVNLPTGLSMNSATGAITGTVTVGAIAGSPYTVDLAVSDGLGGTDAETISWQVTGNSSPVLDPIGAQASDEGQTVSLPAAATDPDGDPLSYSASALPAGLTISPTTGLITGTISQVAASGSPYTSTVSVADGKGGSDSESFSWTVTAVNVAPVLGAIAGQSSNEGASVSLAASATDVDGDALTYAATGLPTGLAMNSTTGAITGTVAAGAAAGSPYAVTASVSDGNGGSASVNFSWIVSVVTGPVPLINYDFTEGSGATVGDSGSGAPLNLTIANPNNVTWLPAGGLVIDAVTTISAPQSQKLDNAVTASGEFTVEAWVTPAAGAQSGPARLVSNAPTQFVRNFMLGQGAYANLPNSVYSVRTRTTASIGGTPELFTSTGVTSASLTHVVATRTASGARKVYVNGVQVGSDTIGGTATNWDGSFPLVLGNVGNGSRGWRGTFCRVSIYDDALSAAEVSNNFGSGCDPTPNTDPVIDPIAAQTNAEGETISVGVTALDADGDTLSYSATNLPDGLAINTATGLITGTVSQTAATGSAYSVTVTVADGNGGSDSETFTWTINPVNVDPVLSTVGDQASEAGEAINLLLAAADDDGDSLTFSGVGLPTGLNIDASGLISGTVDLGIANGTVFAVTVTVSDGQGGTDSETFGWTIAANTAPAFDTPVPGDQTSSEGDTVSITFAATDPDGDPLTYSATGLPADLTIDPSTGEVSGTLSQNAAVGSPYAVTITVADNRDAEAQTQLSWTVDAVNLDPVLDPIADQSNSEGDVVQIPVAASDLDGDELTYSAIGLPGSVAIASDTGLISGVIDAGAAIGSPYLVEVSASDGVSTAVQSFEWSISEITLPTPYASYDFTTGSGNIVSDSGAGEPLDLIITDPSKVTWLEGRGLRVDESTTITTADPDNLVDTDNEDGSSDAIVNPIQASGEFTVEAWIVPGLGTQSGPARVVSNAPDPFSRNFMVGQGAYGDLPNDVFSMRSRTTVSAGGTPELFTPTGLAVPGQLTHLVTTMDTTGQRTMWIDGVAVSSDSLGGTFANWNAAHPFTLANVADGTRPWIGTFCEVNVYDVALDVDQVTSQFGSGCDLPVPEATALVQVTPNGAIGATTFGNSTITVQNTGFVGAPSIAKVEFDVRGSLIPDATFDPVGTAGDEGTQCLEVSAEGGTGYVVPADNCTDPFSLPHEDDPGVAGNGNDGMTLDFTDFGSGESIVFGVDVDPTSIQGVPGAGGAGAVSGLELTGSTVTITFSDGQVLSNEIFGDGSAGGGQAVVAATKGVTAPTGIELVGVAATPTVFPNDSKVAVVDGVGPQVVRVSGPAGSSVTLLDANGQLQSPAPFDPDPFESDTVVSVSYLTGIITGTVGQDGTVDFNVAIDSATDLHHFVATIDDGANGPVSEKLIVAVDAPSGALVQVTPNGAIGASTFTNGTMSISNTGAAGEATIASVTIDLRGSIIPDATFDPNGVAGDTTPKCLEIASGGAATGYVTPGDNCNDPFTVPHEDEPGVPGFGHDVMTMNFTDFGAGETITFAVDIDATSIQGVIGSGGAGSVSGLELTGSLVTVTFDDGATQTAAFSQIFGDGSAGGGAAFIVSTTAVLAPPAIEMVGVATSPTVFTNGSVVGSVPAAGPQTVRVSGAEGDVVTLLQMTGDFVTNPAFDVDEFESDSAVAVDYFTGTISGGFVDFTVDIADTNVLYHYTAIVGDGSNGASTQLVIGVGLAVDAPVIDPISNVIMTAGDTIAVPVNSTSPIGDTITLSIASTPDIEVSGAVFTDNGNGTGSIDWVTDETDVGSYNVTVTATTNSGVTTETFTVLINGSGEGAVLYRVNAGGPEVADPNGGPAWSEDQAVTGGQAGGTATFGTPSPYLTASSNTTSGSAGVIDLSDPSVPAGTPESLFQIERYDSGAATPMVYEFPVGAGQGYEIDLYFAETFVTATGGRVFTVNVEGTDFLVDYDIFEQVGGFTGIVETIATPIVADDFLTITFSHSIQNPKINAVEVRSAGPPPVDVPPTVAPIGDKAVSVGGSVLIPITTTEPDGDVVTISTSSIPDTSAFIYFVDQGNGTATLTFAPTASDVGTYTVTVTASDVDGSTSRAFNLEVLPATPTVVARINAGGPIVASVDGGPDWDADTSAANHPFLLAPGSNGNSGGAAVEPGPTVPSTVPGAIVDTERWSSTGFAYAIPASAGTQVYVRLFLGNAYAGTSGVGDRVFDISIDGAIVADDLDLVASYGHEVAGMLEYLVTSDGVIDIAFSNVVENPLVNGIEVVSAVSNPDVLAATPSPVDFGLTVLNGTPSQTVTLSNLGTDGADPTITVTSVTVAGGEFASNFSGPVAVPAGGTSSFAVTFAPTTIGTQSATITVEHSGTNSPLVINAQGNASNDVPVSFDSAGLVGESSNNPTSLQFGPDDRLYVAQQNGTVKAYDVVRNASNDYAVTATETINLVKENTTNHNDDGAANTSTDRQVTGLLVTGTAANPVLYVTSSDSRIAVGNDTGLDTNSGVVTRLTFNGTSWDKVDVVRGLPRSEENHATNGLALDEATNTLFVIQGGHANKGAPGNNFSGTPEYYLSAALLSVDLDAIDALGTFTDPRDGAEVAYDLRTLDDPSRANITNGDAAFPYPAGHPLFNSSIDVGDPFGGNNGLNQAIPEPGGPVQIYSPGYRNAFDVVFTSQGRLYTSDNGPNTGWGGQPLVYTSTGTAKGTGPFDQGAGDYCTNEFNESASNSHGDPLHFIDGPGYYGGHPAPIRAFPDVSRVITYENLGGWTATNDLNFFDLLPADLSPSDFPNNPIECEYSSNDPAKYLDIVNASTNGIAEYTASNFGGKLQGNILTASFDGNIYSYDLNAAGDAVDTKTSLFSGFGSQPLDVTAQGDGDPFPGTVWAATYGADTIVVFEPSDSGTCTGADDINLDEDGDGFSNADEIDNGTDPCSGGDKPTDNDGDNLSDLNDPDDDNDGLLDTADAFAVDADNGTTTSLPVLRPFENGDPGTDLFGLGLTGLMTNGVTDYLDQFDPGVLNAGGNGGQFGVEIVPPGDAYQGVNTQEYAFQYGIDVDETTAPFVVSSAVLAPLFDGATPSNFQAAGIHVGNGDQDNYLKIVVNANGGVGGIQVLKEEAGVTSSAQYGQAAVGGDVLAVTSSVDLFLVVDPATLTAQPRVSLDGGTVADLGAPIVIPAAWLDGADAQGLAVGIISTSTNTTPFAASWDFLDVEFVGVSNANPTIDGVVPGTSVTVEQGATLPTVTVSASDLDGDTPVLTTDGNEPAGIVFTDAGDGTATFDGTTAVAAGVYPVVVTATDDQSATDTVTVTITVTAPGNGPPAITPIDDQVIAEADTLSLSVAATDPDGDTLTYTLSGDVPVGMTIDASGVITWTSDLDDSGILDLTVAVDDGVNAPVSVSFTVSITQTDVGTVLRRVNAGGPLVATIDAGPDWAANPNPNTLAELVSGGENVYGGNTPITDITDPTVPAGTPVAVFNSERWDPPAGAEMAWNFAATPGAQIEVRIGHGEIFGGTAGPGARVFEVEIDGVVVDSAIDPLGRIGFGGGFVTDYVVTADADGVDVVFLHTPFNNPNPKFFEIIDLATTNTAPQIDTPLADASINETDPYTVTVDASDIDGDTIAYGFVGPVPNGMTIDPSTGQIDWTPGYADSGRYTIAVSVGDGFNSPTTGSYTLDVNQIAPPGSALFRVNAGGPAAAAADATSPDWGGDTPGAPSPYLVANSGGTYTEGGNDISHPTVPGTVPATVFNSERYGQPLAYSFPVDAGTEVEVRLYFAELFVTSSGSRVFDVMIDGNEVVSDVDTFDRVGGANIGEVIDVLVTSDGSIDLSFVPQVDSPALKGIEILGVSGVPGVSILNGLDGATINADSLTVEWMYNGFIDPNDHVHFEINGGPATDPPNDLTINGGGTHNTLFRPVTSIDLTGLSSGTHTVTAQIADTGHVEYGNTESLATATFTVVAVPAAPTVSATDGDAVVTLDWPDVANATGYTVYRSTTPDAVNTGAVVGSPATSGYVDSTVVNGTIYYYAVSGGNGAGEGSPSAEVSGYPLPDTAVIERINAGGVAVASLDAHQGWEADTAAANHPTLTVAGSNNASAQPVAGRDASLPSVVPQALFSNERWTGNTATGMAYALPVPNADPVDLRLFLSNGYFGSALPGQREFNVSIEGVQVLTNFGPVAAYGHQVGGMERFIVTDTDASGFIEITFTHGAADNPNLNGIELREVV